MKNKSYTVIRLTVGLLYWLLIQNIDLTTLIWIMNSTVTLSAYMLLRSEIKGWIVIQQAAS